jgi:hypothetical protein
MKSSDPPDQLKVGQNSLRSEIFRVAKYTAGWSIGWCAVDLVQRGSIDYPRAIASALGAGIVGTLMVVRKTKGEEPPGAS